MCNDIVRWFYLQDSDFDEIYTPYRIPSKRLQDSNESNINPSEAKKQRMDQ